MTLGPVQSNGRTFGPEQGAPTQIKRDSYYVEFGVVTHDWLLPKKAEKNLKEWQGISPAKAKGKDLKKDYQPDFANKGLRENLTKIKEANVRTPLPAPQVRSTFMLSSPKDAERLPRLADKVRLAQPRQEVLPRGGHGRHPRADKSREARRGDANKIAADRRAGRGTRRRGCGGANGALAGRRVLPAQPGPDDLVLHTIKEIAREGGGGRVMCVLCVDARLLARL